MYYYGFDGTYILIIVGFFITMIASAKVKSTYAIYSKHRSACGLTGAQVAQRILLAAGITDVGICHVSGNLTDHYDPRNKEVCLSDGVFEGTSLAALGVAAHECGHAIQHEQNYAPLSIRSALVPVANLGSQAAWPIFFLGLIMNVTGLLALGIILFSAAVVFQLVTLPVEFNASRRALQMLESCGIMGSDEVQGARKVLRAAALTYVAALAASVLQLLRLVILSGERRRRD